MKIDNQDMLSSINLYQNEQISKKDDAARPQEKTQVQQQDRVELSTRKTEIEKLKNTVEAMPDVRTEKVEALKQQLADGSYRVESIKVAQKMLEQFTGSVKSGGSK
ncbi:MAG TPA: flagellar biosynthesis anti-sigma factor FlgM [Geobacteraceae bacterium]|jgi:negative regulator of flagellin synthesis FlgM|nr:flagellar biosynthesis anti-sigma factor FlgM [Geobacteraceae bacterium]